MKAMRNLNEGHHDLAAQFAAANRISSASRLPG
jgi:hypothetical protein